MRSLIFVPLLAVLVACSQKESIHAESNGATGTGGHRMQGAGGGPSSTSATTGAGGSGAGSCCSEPVHVAGTVKTITADTDAEQQVAGLVNTTTGLVVVGPFFLTDFVGYGRAWLSASGDCVNGQGSAIDVIAATSAVHGVRIFVPKNTALCTITGGPIAYGGFKPY